MDNNDRNSLSGFNQEGQIVGGKQYNIGRVQATSVHFGDINQLAPIEVTFPISNLPLANPHFVGRVAQLDRLADTLRGPAAVTQVIAGLGGVGKSQLMLHFAHRNRQAFDILWWVRVDEALAEDFLALGRALGLALAGLKQEAAVQVVRNWLNGTERRWLLLCDNADVIEPRELRQVLPSGVNGRILISSRNPHWPEVGEVVRLGVFSEAEAAVFWTERFGFSEDAARAELAEALGWLPLAMEHAAAYMAVHDMAAADYLALYRARREELWQRVTRPGDYHATITTTWEIAFEQARQMAGAAELLNLCCFLAPDDIPLRLLVEAAAKLSAAATLPEELAVVLGDELALNDALGALGRYSLVERAGGMLDAKLLRIHRLVQTLARDRMGEERARKWAEAAVELVIKALPDWHLLHEWQEGAAFLPHMRAAADLAPDQGVETERVGFLCNWVGFYYKFRGEYGAARPYYERALAIYKQVRGEAHAETVVCLNNLAALLQTMGDLAGARPYFEQALAINEEVLGAEDTVTAVSLGNMGMLLQEMGDLAEARPYFQRALAIFEKVKGADHPDTARSLNNLGGLLQGMGDQVGARPYFERALAIQERVLGADHPDTAHSLNNLGGVLKDLGDWEGARPYFERALAIFEATLGAEHPHTVIVRGNLAELENNE